MAIDTVPQTPSDSDSPNPAPPQAAPQRDTSQVAPNRRWRKRGLYATGLVAVVVAGAAVIPGIRSSREDADMLTYKITRADLVVTVVEQGALESSENTEILCRVRGANTVIEVVASGTVVKKDDVLVELDKLFIEEQIAERTKYARWSRAGAESWRAQMGRAVLAIPEYEEGRFVVELMRLQKDLTIAQASLSTAENMRDHDKRMQKRGYVSALKVEQREFAVKQAELEVEVKQTEIETLKNFDKEERLTQLKGRRDVATAQFNASDERADADASRRDRALEEYEHCTVKAPRDGMVIYPSAAAWENAPDIEEGATVHKDQVLLLMPNLDRMQVKIGIHESIIDRITPGLTVIVTLPDRTLEAQVSSVASVAQQAGWWNGNIVKYDTIIELPSVSGLKPGMSAEVEVIVARHTNVLTIPVAAVVETVEGSFCWVQTDSGPQRRELELGDTNDVFIVVKDGLHEGDDVILNPVAHVKEAQEEALKPGEETKTADAEPDDAPDDTPDDTPAASQESK